MEDHLDTVVNFATENNKSFMYDVFISGNVASNMLAPWCLVFTKP